MAMPNRILSYEKYYKSPANLLRFCRAISLGVTVFSALSQRCAAFLFHLYRRDGLLFTHVEQSGLILYLVKSDGL